MYLLFNHDVPLILQIIQQECISNTQVHIGITDIRAYIKNGCTEEYYIDVKLYQISFCKSIDLFCKTEMPKKLQQKVKQKAHSPHESHCCLQNSLHLQSLHISTDYMTERLKMQNKWFISHGQFSLIITTKVHKVDFNLIADLQMPVSLLYKIINPQNSF